MNMQMAADAIKIEVVYAECERCIRLTLRAAAGESVADIISRCGILKMDLGFDPLQGEGAVGIFSEHVALDAVPEDGDRIEIYRPLKCDPMEARHRRSAVQA